MYPTDRSILNVSEQQAVGLNHHGKARLTAVVATHVSRMQVECRKRPAYHDHLQWSNKSHHASASQTADQSSIWNVLRQVVVDVGTHR